MIQTGTIREIREKLFQDGYHVSEYAIRRWVKEGILPAVYTGNKALISYSNVVKLLEEGTDCA